MFALERVNVSQVLRVYRRRVVAMSAATNGFVRERHGFAPLRQANDGPPSGEKMQLKGVVFDMDGTLCKCTVRLLSAAEQIYARVVDARLITHYRRRRGPKLHVRRHALSSKYSTWI